MSLFSTAFLRNHQAVRDTAELLASNPYPMSPEAYGRQADAYRHFDALDRLPGITAPTLVVVGEQDLLTPPWVVREVAEAIPGAQFEIIRGHGTSHLVPIERPDDFNRLVFELPIQITKAASWRWSKPGTPQARGTTFSTST